MRLIRTLSVIAVVLSFVAAFYFYPRMPPYMASHWNAAGEVDGYMSEAWGLFMLPAMSVIILLLFLIIPLIDPLRKNIEKFIDYYDWFVFVTLLFFFYIYSLTILWNLGIEINMSKAMSPALGALFFFMGVVVSKAKRNYFVGIRTPWTLSSDAVWDKTHRLAGKLFKVAGILCLLGMFSDEFGLWLVIIPVMVASAASVIYSYLVFKKESARK
jgi:uncharacterized membrane protein